MFGSVKYGAGAYAKVGLETGVTAASPHKLIVMLYEGAITAIVSAKSHMASGNIAEKGKSISKSIMIIDNGLRASLNKEVGGDIAENLDGLYQYMTRRLLEANLKNQPELLDEVHTLLMDLKTAWEGIAETNATNQEAPAPAVNASPYDLPPNRTSSLARA